MLCTEDGWGPGHALPRATWKRLSFPSKPRASSGLVGALSCLAVGTQPVGKTPGSIISSFSAAGATMGMAVTGTA